VGIYLIADSTNYFLPVLSMLGTICKVALGIGFVIFVHELGHFLAAKLCGVKCEKFYIGFDPPLKIFGIRLPSRIARFRWGETEYGIGILPLGGYVKMLGQDDNPMNAKKEAERLRAAGLEATVEDGAATISGMDPRNYQAQTVPERMFIISAGIIMNIIFAAIMAAVAFRLGVDYPTCDFSGALPGSAAWKANIRPGDHILQIGRNGTPEQYIRDKDLRERAIFAGLSSDEPKPINLLFEDAAGRRRWVPLAPRQLSKDTPPALGVLFARSNVMVQPDEFFENLAVNQATPKLQEGDQLIAVNGQKLDDSRRNEEGAFVAWQVDELLEAIAAQPLTLTVSRTDKDTKKTENVDVVVPPQPMRWLGFTVRIGPVTAIRDQSPADKAGINVGDVIYGINGVTVGDPLTLPTRFAQLGKKELTLNVWHKRERTSKYEQREFVVTPNSTEINASRIGPDLALEGIGLSYTIRNVVWKVSGDTPAANAVQAGDRIKAVTRVATSEELRKQLLEKKGKNFFKQVELKQPLNWIIIRDLTQE